MKPNYVYSGSITRVIDGDTIEATVDLGFHLNVKMAVRLAHINAKEKNEKGGKADTEYLKGLIGKLPAKALIRTFKPIDKYGRWLAEVYIEGKKDHDYINQAMVDGGHAVAYEGEAR